MINKKISFFCFIMIFTFVNVFNSMSQYSYSPSTTLMRNQNYNLVKYDSIHIANNSGAMLSLKWKLIQYDTAGGTYIDFCSSGNCWLGFPDTGSFAPIYPGGFGWAGVHLWTGNSNGNSTAKIWVYKEGFPLTGDTLTFILYAMHGSGIENNNNEKHSVNVFPNPTTDKITIRIKGNISQEAQLSLYNTIGELISTTYTFKNAIEIPLNNVNNGIYFLNIRTGNSNIVKKIIVSR
jgi:hypothetical protein